MTRYKLSIIIVHYHSPKQLAQCIDSLFNTVKRTPYEVIVVDSGSDGTAAKIIDRPAAKGGVKLIAFRENTGYAKAVNAGIRSAAGEFILVLNADIIAEPDAVDDLVAFFEKGAIGGKPIGLAGPRLLGLDGSVQNSAFRFYSPWTIVFRRTFLRRLSWGRKHLDRFLMKDKDVVSIKDPREVDWLMGAALLTSRSAIEKIGLMDEKFFMYFEDIDWARRFWKNGYSVVYYPGSVMRHLHGRASKRLGLPDVFFNKMTRTHIKSAIIYFLKYGIK